MFRTTLLLGIFAAGITSTGHTAQLKLEPGSLLAPAAKGVPVSGARPYLSPSTVKIDRGYQQVTEQRYFDGFIYPGAIPSQSLPDQRQRFEVDAPLATRTNATKQYYSFGLSVKISTPGKVKFGVSGTTAIVAPQGRSLPPVKEFEQVSGLCREPANSKKLRTMHGISMRSTGVKSWAAYNTRIDRYLAAGTPVFWETCASKDTKLQSQSSGVNRKLTRVRTPVEKTRHFVVLLPAALVRSSGSTLSLHTYDAGALVTNKFDKSAKRVSASPQRSPALSLVLVPSPLFVAAVGDSMAWGQGLRLQEKHLSRFQRGLNQPTRGFMFAHSGAKTGYNNQLDLPIPPIHRGATEAAYRSSIQAAYRPNITHAAQQLGSSNDYCERDRDFSGEVPRRHPTTMCQVAQSAQMNCQVLNPGLPNVKFRCESNEPIDPGSNHNRQRSERIPTQRTVPIDIRPRYDYVLMTTCLNDLSAGDVAFGGGDSEADLRTLGRRVVKKCDLRRGLSDVRSYYPNAAVMVTGYHRYMSVQTFRRFCTDGRDILSAEDFYKSSRVGAVLAGTSTEDQLGNLVGGTVDSVLGALDSLITRLTGGADSIVNSQIPWSARVQKFRRSEQAVRRTSIAALNQANAHKGRGKLVQVPIGWKSSQAAFGENAMVFGLDCSLADLTSEPAGIAEILEGTNPADPRDIFEPRREACARYANAHNDNSSSTNNEGCKRASAFHPNATGAGRISDNLLLQAREQQVMPGSYLALPTPDSP